MDWSAVIKNPFLKNLPFKIELNKWGQILMSPAGNNHGNLQFNLSGSNSPPLAARKKTPIRLIPRPLGRGGFIAGSGIHNAKKGYGEVITECSINTSQGVKMADVAWASDEFIQKHGFETPYNRAPEICVEVVSPSNPEGEIDEKIELYLAKGAIEVWIVSEDGSTKYYSYEGELEESQELTVN